MKASFELMFTIRVAGVPVEADAGLCEIEFDYSPAQRGSFNTEPLPESVDVCAVMFRGFNLYPVMDRDSREELHCQILQFLKHTRNNI